VLNRPFASCSELQDKVHGIGAKKQAVIEPHCCTDCDGTLSAKVHKGE